MKIDSLCGLFVLGAVFSTLLPGCVAGEAGEGEGAEDVGAVASEIGFGTVEPNAELPWVLHIGSGCHGVLVHDRWVLTAAHCVDTKFNGVTVSFTRTNPTTGEVVTGSQPTGVGSVFAHPSWDPSTIANDIALVRLPSAFAPNPMLRRAELPLRAPVAGQEGTVASTVPCRRHPDRLGGRPPRPDLERRQHPLLGAEPERLGVPRRQRLGPHHQGGRHELRRRHRVDRKQHQRTEVAGKKKAGGGVPTSKA